MLQRAASNAYSWWWASHIRTKQSKWLDESLQDMEDRVQTVLKLIQEDGDSFAKRAEMYYKKRPELISFVEETYRAYRSLAERYDRISTELQNANSTIASVFPERVQFAMEDEEDYNNPPHQFPRNMATPSMGENSNIPKVPTTPTRLKGLLTTAMKTKKPPKTESKSKTVAKSGLTKSEAIEEIDRLQKEILALQTVKEFVKSSYESGLKKHMEIENQITELQGKVFSLQDEFKVQTIIEDDEARSLMAEAALKSCQQTLANLHEKQELSSEKAKAESERIDNAREKLKCLKKNLLPDHQDDEDRENYKEAKIEKVDNSEEIAENKKIEEVGLKGPLTVTELVEKIDDLVTEVINLEASVSSQTVLVDRLKSEMDDLQTQVQALEGDKMTLSNDKESLTNKLREMEEKLNELQRLKQNVENENKNLKTHFVGARSSHDFLSEKLDSVKLDEEATKVGEEILEKSVKLEDLRPELGNDIDKQVLNISANNQAGKEEEGELLNQKYPESAATKEEDEQDYNNLAAKQVEKEKEGKVPKQEDSSSNATKEDEKVQDLITANNQTKTGEEEQVSNPEGLKSASTSENDEHVPTSTDKNKREKGEAEASQIMTKNEKEIASSQKQVVEKTPDEDHKDVAKKQDETIKNKPGEMVNEKDEEMNWQEMLLNGLEDREKVLLAEYTSILRNYKEVKNKLSNVEKTKEDSIFELTLQLREQKDAISKRDQEIRSLRQKLNLLQENSEENTDLGKETETSFEILSLQNEEVLKSMLIDQSRSISPIEERLRTEIDALLDQNLDFWLRFSTSFHLIQKYRNSYQDLQEEVQKVKEKRKSNRESSGHNDIKSELRPIYRHLTEIQTELTIWIEQSASLKEELHQRFSSLCNIQEEITTALKTGAEEDEMRFTSHEAAKFQGEVVNMKQENNKVRDELEAGLEHVNKLQNQIKKTLGDLMDELGLSGQRSSPSMFGNSGSRRGVPLRSFIFGTKPKKKSIFRR